MLLKTRLIMLMVVFNQSSFKYWKIRSKLEIKKLSKLGHVHLLVLFIMMLSLLPTVGTPKDSLWDKIHKSWHALRRISNWIQAIRMKSIESKRNLAIKMRTLWSNLRQMENFMWKGYCSRRGPLEITT